MQRRKQKLIEEAPSPVLTRSEAEYLCKSAARLAKAAGYYSAGTVEFLMDGKKNFYLMEVNTRVQVEHPVTEMITGIDIVQTQIRVAAGEPLPFRQKDIKVNGHAIEARINAEDPERNFAPCAGVIKDMFVPGGLGVRLDTHSHAGYRIPPNYDSMIGKLIVHRTDREQALNAMVTALREFHIDPIKTTIPLHIQLMQNGNFRKSDIDINFVERLLGQQ
jgi:acetyl-CoA carboxylase biotin carboxylase subunit